MEFKIKKGSINEDGEIVLNVQIEGLKAESYKKTVGKLRKLLLELDGQGSLEG